MFCSSNRSLKGLFRVCPVWMVASSAFGYFASRMGRAPKSSRMTVAGRPCAPSESGTSRAMRRRHCATASSPPLTMRTRSSNSSGPSLTQKLPSGRNVPHRSYWIHSGSSPMIWNTCCSGLKLSPPGAVNPEYSEGPDSNVYGPYLKSCAQPPKCSWLSSTVTRRPLWASIAAQQRPPRPDPMTTTSVSWESAAVSRRTPSLGVGAEAVVAAMATRVAP
mmetsp:Transcript_23140/g.39689  ORF Transcript_23140/g.39689 Transcript_23140/m.39689 type:complete len:219 (-) Transcript_23140:503-1159(-)